MEHWTVAGDGLAPPLPSLGPAPATSLLAVAALGLVTRPVRASTSGQISPSYVGEPECNGVAERFMRTLKEQCLYLPRFLSLTEARTIIGAFGSHTAHSPLVSRKPGAVQPDSAG